VGSSSWQNKKFPTSYLDAFIHSDGRSRVASKLVLRLLTPTSESKSRKCF